MKYLLLTAAVAAAGLVFGIGDARAQAVPADNPHTWVGRGGSDNSTCGAIGSPCRSLPHGIARTQPGGEVQCLETVDTGVLGGATITKSITISCDTAKWSNSVGTSNVSLIVNVAASDIVTLRGFHLDGSRTVSFTGDNIFGLLFNGAGTLILDNVQLTGWTESGVRFEPNGPAKLVVSNSLIAGNGSFNSNTGAGIRIVLRAGGTAQINISRTDLSRNVFGIAVDGSNSTGGVNATITDSVSSGNAQDGIVVTSSAGTAPIGVLLTNVKSTNNAYGVRSIGSNVTVRVDNSKIAGNGTGVLSLGGGALLTGGGNTVQANAINGSFTGSYALQ